MAPWVSFPSMGLLSFLGEEQADVVGLSASLPRLKPPDTLAFGCSDIFLRTTAPTGSLLLRLLCLVHNSEQEIIEHLPLELDPVLGSK